MSTGTLVPQVDPQLEMWREPVRGGYPDRALFELSGLEQLRASLRPGARQSPIGHLTGMRLTEVGAGKATFTMPASHWLLAPHGGIPIGQVAILADGPLGCAVMTSLPPATAYTTSELSLRLVRPAPVGGMLSAKGQLIYGGRTIALSEVAIEDQDGRLIAHGSSLCFVFPSQPRSDPSPSVPEVGVTQKQEPEYATPDPYLRPMVGAIVPQEMWGRMSGLEILRALAADELPPSPNRYLTGLRMVDASEGETTFVMPASEWLCPPTARVEGGMTAMLADAALGAAIMTLQPPGIAMATVDLKVNFVRPVLPDGRDLVARGKVAHSGRTIAVAHSEVTNADGKVVALATGSAVFLPGRAASLVDLKVD